MAMTYASVRDLFRTPGGRKLFRYSMASVVAVAVSLVCLVIFNGVIGWSAWVSSTLATAVATVPSYEMNRKWAWGKSGRSHMFKEVIPFWALAFLGWGFSTFCVHFTEGAAEHHDFSHALTTFVVAIAYVGAFGVLWVGKFIIFNRVLFAHHPQDLPALEGRSGVPG